MSFAAVATLVLAAGTALASPRLMMRQAMTNSTSSNATMGAMGMPNATVQSMSGATYVGNYYQSFNQDVYLGIPFAQPPVGNLRFVAPQPLMYNGTNTTVVAKTPTPACLQIANGSLAGVYGVNEDCLTLNVYAPHGLNSTSQLPVMVWIYGGGFIEGTANTYNATALIAQSVQQQEPIVFVAMNYRLGIWGWAQGAEAAANNATNLGLKDQLAAIQWVHDNIAAFGGDPSKVTLVGESAGAISIALHYINPDLQGADSNSTMSNMTSMSNSTPSPSGTGLFRGAIMESGTMSTYPIYNASLSRQTTFDQIANLTGCATNATMSGNGTFGSAAYNSSVFECLKNVNNVTLFNATVAVLERPENQIGNFVFGPSIDGTIVPASPASLIRDGKFLKYPFISGNNLDEGTIFYPPYANTSASFTGFVDTVFPNAPNATVINTLMSYYSDYTQGSPFGTGNETFGYGPEFKIGAAIVGDVNFQAPRREFLARATQYGLNQTWSYQFEQNLNTSSPYGVSHGSEVAFVFGAYDLNATSPNGQLGLQMGAYWINFISSLNPNGNAASAFTPLVAKTLNLTTWPTYTTSTSGGNMNLLRLKSGNLTVFQDTYRASAMQYINSIPEALNH